MVGTAESLSMTKPVFNDETGRRAAVLLWAGRVVIAVCAILGVAIARLTAMTQQSPR